jgi:transposase InsO family protein
MTRQKQRKRKKNDNIIKHTYFNTKSVGGFTSNRGLTRALKNKKINKEEISKWLSKTDTYTLHKPVKKRFKRRKYIVSGINALWQADLTDLTSISKYNQGFKFILFNIDVFTKQATAIPIKSKSSDQVTDAFEKILSIRKSTPNSLQTDKGAEFFNAKFQKMLRNHKINHYVTENQEIKASHIERLQRTVKERMYRYFTHSGSYHYIDVLHDIVEAYNNTIHSTIGTSPNDVNYTNQEEIWQAVYNDRDNISISYKSKYSIGDRVRISKYSTTFKKGYLPNWSEEIFTISKVHSTSPVVYSLKDDSGEELKGTWYEPELQLVKISNNIFKIEEILSSRKINGKTQYLVKWAGYPSHFNSYVNKSDIITAYKN